MDAAQNDPSAHNAPSAPLPPEPGWFNPWCCLDSPVSIPSRGPTDYQGSWHRINRAHPLVCCYRFQEYWATSGNFFREKILQGALRPRQDFEQRADAALQIRTLPDTTLLMPLGSRTCPSQNVFFFKLLFPGVPRGPRQLIRLV